MRSTHRQAVWLATAVIGSVVCAPRGASAESLDAIFQRANRAFYAGNTDAAIRGYGTLLDAGVSDPDVFFNLATAHARAGHLGQAIRFYEKVLRIAPGHADAERGLSVVRETLGRRLAEEQGEALVQERPPFLDASVRSVTENTLAWLALCANLALFGVAAALLFTRRESVRLGLGVALPLLGIALVVFGGGLVVKSGVLSEGRSAIVIAPSSVLREGPNAEALGRGQVPEGSAVRILEDQSGFARVRAPDRREGWVRAGELGDI